MMNVHRAWFAVAFLILAAGCGDSTRNPRDVRSNGGNYTVVFTPSPDPVPMNQLFDLMITIAPKSGAAPPAKVEVDARMPAHGHGMNRVPKVTRVTEGTVKAEGMLFHMPGHWELYVDITHGGVTERAQFDIHLK
jgi:hypothetical protein